MDSWLRFVASNAIHMPAGLEVLVAAPVQFLESV